MADPAPRTDPPPQQFGQGLTSDEHEALQMTADLWGVLMRIVQQGPTRDQDLRDLGQHIHGIQHAVMAQAAGRAYPNRYRLLGNVIDAEGGGDSGRDS